MRLSHVLRGVAAACLVSVTRAKTGDLTRLLRASVAKRPLFTMLWKCLHGRREQSRRKNNRQLNRGYQEDIRMISGGRTGRNDCREIALCGLGSMRISRGYRSSSSGIRLEVLPFSEG